MSDTREHRIDGGVGLKSGLAMNWIDGVSTDSSKRMESFDPATGLSIGTYAEASLQDAEAATAAAFRAFQSTDWKANRRLRARVLNQLADYGSLAKNV